MDNYLLKYADTVKNGLVNTIASDKNGNKVQAEDLLSSFAEFTETKRKEGALFFFCGNGASASMAEHMSHDFFQNGDIQTYTVSETSHITAISNDYSYEDVFAYRIEKLKAEKGVLVTISSSGSSSNIIKAIYAARKRGWFVATFSGKSEDNPSRLLGDYNFYVPLSTYGLVESAHAVLLHCWLDMYLDLCHGGKH
jgi:D-sedoheptulose 7-phosphate isomerase